MLSFGQEISSGRYGGDANMLKLLFVSLGILASLNGFSSEKLEVLLRDKEVELGKIMGDEVTLVDREVILVRDDQSPDLVTLNIDYHKLQNSCVEYEIKSKSVDQISVNRCDAVNTGSSKELYNCEKKSFDGFEVLKRVCSKKGQILKKVSKKIRVVFMRSVKLAPGAKEIFSLQLNQKKITSGGVKIEAKVENSSSLYKVNNLFDSIIEYKAK